MKLQLLLFGLLFVAFTSLMVFYANKDLVVYQKTSNEKIYDSDTVYHTGEVTRTYQDNYAASGGSIAFGILGAAALLSFTIILIVGDNTKRDNG